MCFIHWAELPLRLYFGFICGPIFSGQPKLKLSAVVVKFGCHGKWLLYRKCRILPTHPVRRVIHTRARMHYVLRRRHRSRMTWKNSICHHLWLKRRNHRIGCVVFGYAEVAPQLHRVSQQWLPTSCVVWFSGLFSHPSFISAKLFPQDIESDTPSE